MSEEEKLDEAIAKAEEELRLLQHQRSNNDTPGAGPSAAPPSAQPSAQPAEPEVEHPLSELRALHEEAVEADGVMLEQLQARVAISDAVGEELMLHQDTLDRVAAQREQFMQVNALTLLRRFARHSHHLRRVRTYTMRFLNDVLRTMYSPPDYMTIQVLLDRLLTRMQEFEGDPYLSVTDDMYPEHLSTLERAGIIHFHDSKERRIRIMEIGLSDIDMGNTWPAEPPSPT